MSRPLPPPTDNEWLLMEPICGPFWRPLLLRLASLLSPRERGYRPKASGKPKPPPPPGRGPVIP